MNCFHYIEHVCAEPLLAAIAPHGDNDVRMGRGHDDMWGCSNVHAGALGRHRFGAVVIVRPATWDRCACCERRTIDARV